MDNSAITPNTVHMERTVLGAMILESNALLDGVERMRAGDFALASHRRIFRTMHSMAMSGVDMNESTLIQQLSEERALEEVGGKGYLWDLTVGIPRRFSIASYAHKLRELSKIRSLALSFEEGLTKVAAGEPLDDLIAFADQRLTDIQAEQEGCDASVIAALPALIASFQGESAKAAIPTGLIELDRMTFGGLKPGQLWILGAHPGRGKSSLARQIVHDGTSAGTPCFVFSIEMTKTQWLGLDAAYRAGVDAWKVQAPELLNKAERAALVRAAEDLAQLPLFIEDAGSIHIRHLLARARAAVLRQGVKLLVIDYVGRVDSDEKDIRLRTGAVAKALAEFAKRHGIAVLLLSQLARRGDMNLRPTMQDLKESGELEAHAHVVLLAHRPQDAATAEPTGEDELIVGKNRFGKTGIVNVTYDARALRFMDRGFGAQPQRRSAA
jgi:replicative DNA helicase